MTLVRLVLPILVVLIAGCGGTKPGIQTLPSEETEFLKARKEHEDKNWVRATELLTAFVESHPGSNRLDEALMMLGLSHQQTGENLLAIEDLSRLIRDFPQSPLREQAEFERARSHFLDSPKPALDPESTEIALGLMEAYVNHYPQGVYNDEARRMIDLCLEKLATKAYLNAQTYLKLGRDRAAVIYLEKALASKGEFTRAGETMAELGRAYARLGETEKARAAWQRLLRYATPDRIGDRKRLEHLEREAREALDQLPSAEKGEPSP